MASRRFVPSLLNSQILRLSSGNPCSRFTPQTLLRARSLRTDTVVAVFDGDDQNRRPRFPVFRKEVNRLYREALPITGGKLASYIPELANVDPRLWGVSICTVDGQRHSIGEADVSFTLQSVSKCTNYAIAVNELGSERIHRYVGKEPSGAHFNSLLLNTDDVPHNPMVNSGAITLCSLIKPSWSVERRTKFMLQKMCAMAGEPEGTIDYDVDVYRSEIETAHRNHALVHYMKDMQVFPAEVYPEETIQFYTRLCSVKLDCNQGAVVAATLANGGNCPLNNEQVISTEGVCNTLSLMQSCGMYNSAGEFSFSVGLPAKSGVSGVILLVVPRVMGLCLYSPRLDDSGNSLRGLQFCKSLVASLGLHPYDFSGDSYWSGNGAEKSTELL